MRRMKTPPGVMQLLRQACRLGQEVEDRLDAGTRVDAELVILRARVAAVIAESHATLAAAEASLSSRGPPSLRA